MTVNMGIGKETSFEATYEATYITYEAIYWATYDVTNLEEITIIDGTFKQGLNYFLK